jgi:hypothetical protein
MRRVTVADKRRPMQMRRCIPATRKKLEWTLMDLTITFGGSDGFFHFVFMLFNNFPNCTLNTPAFGRKPYSAAHEL